MEAVDVMDPKSKRVLVIAEAANPEWVSVPLVGWSLATALLRKLDVHIVTQIRNRDAFLRAGLVEGTDFTAIDSEAFARPAWKLGNVLRMGDGKGWTMIQAISTLSYPYFERLVWAAFKDRLKAGEFDVVHRITPLSPTATSSLAKRCNVIGIPFVLGPLNGGVPWPKGFDKERRREREWLSYVRGIYKLLPGRSKTLTNATAIIAGSKHTESEIPSKHQDKVFYLPENAVDPARFNPTATAPSLPLRACFIGRMVAYKGPDMLIEASLPLLKEGKLFIDFIGDGPLLPEVQEFATKNGVNHAVKFHGWVAHEQVHDRIQKSALLAFPSVREFGGGVVLEAMAMGIVPLIVDYAGPGELVDDTTGFKVPIGTRSQIVAGFRQALIQLATSPDVLGPKSIACQQRIAEHFTWDRKADQIEQIYNWILDPTRPRPELLRTEADA